MNDIAMDDLLDSSIEDENESSLKNFNLVTTPNDFNALTLISFMDRGVFKIPSFQRNFVWDIQKSSKLIESLILGLPIPQIFLYERGRNSFEVIDGQQRLLSLYFFFKGRFPKPLTRIMLRDKENSSETEFFKENFLKDDDFFTNFSLKLLSKSNPETHNHPLNNKNIHTLNPDYKMTLELSTIRNMVVKPADTVDDDHFAMFEIFNRLNSGGMNLNNQEIRMSLYTSDFLNLLLDLNSNVTWRSLVGKDSADLRLRDVELILRLFAMLLCGTDEVPLAYPFLDKSLYQNSILAFLNRFANESKKFSTHDLEKFKSIWNSFMCLLADVDLALLSNSNSYSKSAKVSVPVLEAIFYGLYRGSIDDEVSNQELTNQMIINLKETSNFLSYCVDKTTSKSNVHLRLEIAHAFFIKNL